MISTGYKKLVVPTIVIIMAIALPFVIKAPYFQHIIIMIFIWATLGTAWNLLGGYAGQVSFGHAAFFGLGAYSAGLLIFHLNVSPWWGLALGPVISMVVAIPIGLVCFRLRGPYFALATLALGEIFRLVFTNWVSLTNGAQGILILNTFSTKIPYYFIAFLIWGISLIIVDRMIKSKLGYYFVSIREDQDAAESLGIPTTRYKMFALLPSAFIAGLVGAFYMNYIAFIDPHVVFSLSDISVMVILVVMMGGVATLLGPSIGAAIYIALSELFRAWLGSANVLAFGIIVCLVILFMPNGIIGELGTLKRLFIRQDKKAMVAGGN
ncbi:amino acid/amide ABC transporter membrane protein 2, HAAT family [Desulfofundulus australicus DSM 11792]|uniref:Amino acid/amide ABC transporter membrane protein 2, HAAT family n=1 Tax=Desulfofundulus australicus DSM 11792 TaxID=1121425 RepID=A0A1M4TZC0_9FIRM|nr:branched-chain amino acid ABC transporter permease [Desulfofundulus australicus]SHE49838.1 amino acid/amide ABC transporter membrane protein 2, HAAT family [Desulfofundulus australicus DSM 11792]